MFNYLAMMPNCSEGNVYKSQERQLIKLADQDIEDNHPHLVTAHLIQIKPVLNAEPADLNGDIYHRKK